MSSSSVPVRPPSQVIYRPPLSFGRQVVADVLGNWGARVGVAIIALMVLAAVFAPFIANSMPLLVKSHGQWSSPLLRNLTPADVTLIVLFFAAVMLALAGGWTVAGRIAAFLWIGAVTLPLTLWAAVIDNWHAWSGGFLDWSPRYGQAFLILCLGSVALLDLGAIVLIPLRVHAMFRQRMVILICMIGVAALLIAFPIRPPLVAVYEEYRQGVASGTITDVVNVPLPFSPDDRLRDQPDLRLTPPTLMHPMGTTVNGADLASNMIHATRIALSIGFISTGISAVLGIIVGGLMGYYSGLVDLFGMRVVEIFSAIPTLLLLLCFVAFFGGNLYIMMAIIGITGWVGDAVFVRAEFLRLRQQDFVQAATACGIPLRSILFRHMLPNGLTPIIVNASFGIASAILYESTLSFLGIGLTDETSWGRLLNQALGEGGTFFWWIALYPGLAIFLTVFAYNLIGEALRDAIDPHLKKQA